MTHPIEGMPPEPKHIADSLAQWQPGADTLYPLTTDIRDAKDRHEEQDAAHLELQEIEERFESGDATVNDLRRRDDLQIDQRDAARYLPRKEDAGHIPAQQ